MCHSYYSYVVVFIDKVYNVTPYMKFHPGGVDELMRGAGMNATQLFNDVHAWVNIQNMLEKCLVGYLVTSQSSETLNVTTTSAAATSPAKKPLAGAASAPSDKVTSLNAEGMFSSALQHQTPSVVTPLDSKNIPVLDSYQSKEIFNVIIYTKCKSVATESVIIDKVAGTNDVLIFVYTRHVVFKYNIGMDI